MSKSSSKLFKLTIRKKLLLVTSILLIIPIVSLGLVSYKTASEETDALIEKNLKNSVSQAVGITSMLESSVKSGAMTEEQAKEEFRQIIIGVKQEDGTRTLTDAIDLGPNGYFFVLDDKGELLAHPLLEGTNIWDKKTSDGTYYIQDMIKTAQDGGGFTYYKWPLPNSEKEALKVAYSQVATDWGWIVSAGSYMQDYQTGQQHILEAIQYTLIVCLIAGAIILTLFAQHIARPIRRMTAAAEQIARGDLTGAAIHIRNRDEIGLLADSFNQLARNVKHLVSGLVANSDTLSTSASQLSHVTNETTNAANYTANSISEVAFNNETQARGVQETSLAMEEMAMGIQRIAVTSTNAHEASISTFEEAENGNELIQLSTERMNSVKESVGNLSVIISGLEQRSQQIGEIVVVIQEISSQTNLLALNAAIEAARAGEQGRGFAVVAGEVRKLAERSNHSAIQVSELIDTIREDIENAAESMQRGEKDVAEGVAAIESTGRAFQRIREATRGVSDQVQEASAAAEQMSASSQEISSSLQEMERMAVNTAGAAQSVAAATEEQLASLEEIDSSANKLQIMSEEMREMTHKFKI